MWGGNACIDKTRIPVWLIESYRRQGWSDAELLDFYPHLNAADFVNVWAYADAQQLPDAFQVAVALAADCDAFLTNDATFRRVAELRVLVLDDLNITE